MGTALGPKYIPYSYMDPLGTIPNHSSNDFFARLHSTVAFQSLDKMVAKNRAYPSIGVTACRRARCPWGGLGFRV